MTIHFNCVYSLKTHIFFCISFSGWALTVQWRKIELRTNTNAVVRLFINSVTVVMSRILSNASARQKRRPHVCHVNSNRYRVRYSAGRLTQRKQYMKMEHVIGAH